MAEHDEYNEVHEHLQAVGYIDPGAGSTFTQLFLAAYFKLVRSIKSVFGRKKRDDD